jgi:DNA-binding MarR family transcriptional regulator
MQELQERSLFTYGGMTRLVDCIEHQGLVCRERVPGDRCGVYVVLSDEGVRALEAAMVRHQADVERAFADRLSPAQHAAVETLLPFWQD